MTTRRFSTLQGVDAVERNASFVLTTPSAAGLLTTQNAPLISEALGAGASMDTAALRNRRGSKAARWSSTTQTTASRTALTLPSTTCAASDTSSLPYSSSSCLEASPRFLLPSELWKHVMSFLNLDAMPVRSLLDLM